MRRRDLLGIGLTGLWLGLPLHAQQNRIYRIAVLSARPAKPEPYFGAFVQGMRDLGYVESRNLVIEWRFADDRHERLPALAAELVALKPEVIVTHATQAVHALKSTTTTIPIVMTSTSDPVGSGFVASLARPGGNITGLTLVTVDLSAKHVELLHQILPSLKRVAALMNSDNSYSGSFLKSVQSAAQNRGIEVMPVWGGSPAELERGFEAMARERASAVIVATDSYFTSQRTQLARLALKHRIALMTINSENVRVGALISYGTDVSDSYRRAATFVDKILRGAKPGELPIEQPTTFRLAVNRGTAKTLGLTLPKELLARADEVID